MTPEEQEARDVAWAEARRADLLVHIAEAEAALREANRHTFRDAMGALFERQPALESVRFEQEAVYDGSFYALEIEALWLDDLHFEVSDPILDGDAAPNLLPPRVPRPDPSPVPAAFPDPAHDPRGPRTHAGGVAVDYRSSDAEWRAAYGPAYDAGLDAVATLRGLRERYGLHFFWDAFGAVAAVEATRDGLRVSDAVTMPNEHAGGPRETRAADLGPLWVAEYLGPYAPAYLTSPERAPHVAVREAYRAEHLRVSRYLAGAYLDRTARAMRDARPLSYSVARAHHDLLVTMVGVAGHAFEVDDPLRDGPRHALGPYVPGAPTDPYPIGPPPGLPTEEAYARLVETHDAATIGALRRWLEALAEARRRYGRAALPRPSEAYPQTLTYP